MQFAKSLIAASLLALSTTLPTTQAQAQQANPLITADEHGNGTLLFPGGTPITMPFSLTNDSGPGGLSNALTYNMLGPPSLVGGDVILSDNVATALFPGDVIRFFGNGFFIFYSDNTRADGADALADTGLPTALLANTVTLPETGPEGSNGAFYTPTANQPGFVAGFNVMYHFISDGAAVPEPATWAMMLIGFGAIGVALRHAKRTQPAFA